MSQGADVDLFERVNDPRRLSAVSAAGVVDRTLPAGLVNVASLIRLALGTPYGSVTVTDAHHTYWKDTLEPGSDPVWDRRTTNAHSFSPLVIEAGDVVRLDDTRIDERSRHIDLLATHGVRSWLGVPFLDGDGEILGSVCACDVVARTWTDADVRFLEHLAAIATDEIEAGKTSRAASRSEALLDAVLTQAPIYFMLLDPDHRIEMVNDVLAADVPGVTRDQIIGSDIRTTMPVVADSVIDAAERVMATGRPETGVEIVRPTPNEVHGERSFSCSFYRLRLEPGIRIAIVAEDVTQRIVARQRAESLAVVAEAFARANSTNDITRVLESDAQHFLELHSPTTNIRHVELDESRGRGPELVDRLSSLLRAPADLTEQAIRGEIAIADQRPEPSRTVNPIAPISTPGSVAVVPCLTSESRLVGIMSVAWKGRTAAREFSVTELRTIGRLIGNVIERTRLDQERRAVVAELQTALLASPRRRDHVEIEVRYEPARGAAGLGGDWFDAVAIDDAHTALVVGDVVGHGPIAAASMSQISSTIGPLLVLGHPLPELFTEADRVLAARGLDQMASVGVCVIDTDAHTITSIAAGHPPALLLDPAGRTRLLPTGLRPPLSTYTADVVPAVSEYEPGSVLVMFTDGLVETRERDITDDLDRLAAFVASCHSVSLAALVDRLVGEFAEETGRFDDLAVLAARLGSSRAG